MRSLDAAYGDRCHTWRGLCVCLCVGHADNCATTAEPIEMPFGRVNSCGPKEPYIRWGPDPP